jgi:hypothetical protein
MTEKDPSTGEASVGRVTIRIGPTKEHKRNKKRKPSKTKLGKSKGTKLNDLGK